MKPGAKYDIFGQLFQEDADGTITDYALDGRNPAKAGGAGPRTSGRAD